MSRTSDEIVTLGLSEDTKIIKSKIKITNSKIKGIKFVNIAFANSVNFEATEFLESTDFTGAWFCCPTSFNESIFFHPWFRGTSAL